MKAQIKKLKELYACCTAIEWAEQQTDPQRAWDDCKRGDWMFWLLGKLCGDSESESRKKLVLAACECARLSLIYVPEKEDRPLKTIETAEAWAKGKGVSLQAVKENVAAVDAASASDAATYAAYAASASDAATYAAYAASAASAASAAYASASAASDAADAYAADDAKKETLKKCADIVRKHYPEVPNILISHK